MAFCVECGAVGPTVDGLCANDFARLRSIVKVPERVDLPQCPHCGSLNVGRVWVRSTPEEVLPGLLAAKIEKDVHVERADYAYAFHRRDARNLVAAVTASCRVGPWEMTRSNETTIRMPRDACPACSKRMGRYYVGTVQLRGDGRSLTKAELRRSRELMRAMETEGRTDEFVSRVEEAHGGLDIFVSTNALAKRISREVAGLLGGSVSSSPTLHGRREGKDLYRVTYVVRLPGFREGDVLLWRRTRYRVVRLGSFVYLEDTTTGKRTRVRLRDLRGARVA